MLQEKNQTTAGYRPLTVPLCFFSHAQNLPFSARKPGLMFSHLIHPTKPSINKSIIGKHPSTFNFGFPGRNSFTSSYFKICWATTSLFHMLITVSKLLLKHFCCALNSVSSNWSLKYCMYEFKDSRC